MADIRKSGALFIRKVSKEIDPNIFHLLPVNNREEIPNIEWPNHVKISWKINFESFPWDRYKKDLLGA